GLEIERAGRAARALKRRDDLVSVQRVVEVRAHRAGEARSAARQAHDARCRGRKGREADFRLVAAGRPAYVTGRKARIRIRQIALHDARGPRDVDRRKHGGREVLPPVGRLAVGCPHAVDAIAVVLEHGEGKRVVGRYGERGRRARDAGNAGSNAREALYAAAREVVAKDVRHAVGLGDEVETAAVGGEVRVDVLAAREERQDVDAAGLDVEQRDVEIAECEAGKVRARPAVGDERDKPAVRRELGLDRGIAVIGEPRDLAALELDRGEIARGARYDRDDDRATARLPRGT